jgi:hypothetical protein
MAPQHQAERMRAPPQSSRESKINTRPLTTQSADIYDNANSSNAKQNYPGNIPAKYKELADQMHEWDRRQEEENRRVSAAIAICHC